MYAISTDKSDHNSAKHSSLVAAGCESVLSVNPFDSRHSRATDRKKEEKSAFQCIHDLIGQRILIKCNLLTETKKTETQQQSDA